MTIQEHAELAISLLRGVIPPLSTKDETIMANDKMSYAGDICHISGKYKDDQGKEKNRYVKCGAYFQAGDRIGIKLEYVPLGIDPTKGLWFSLFPKKDSNNSNNSNKGSNNNNNSGGNNGSNNNQSDNEVPF